MTQDNSLLINKYILKILKENTEISQLTSNQIYPLIAKNSTKFPFIVFQRGQVEVEYAKYEIASSNVEIEIACVSDNYEKSLILANKVRHAFELQSFTFEDLNINNITLIDCSEDFIDEGNAFCQKLILKVEII